MHGPTVSGRSVSRWMDDQVDLSSCVERPKTAQDDSGLAGAIATRMNNVVLATMTPESAGTTSTSGLIPHFWGRCCAGPRLIRSLLFGYG